jgi:hypothetical protein
MATITIPDELKMQAVARAAEAGYATVDEYVAAVLQADAGTLAEPELEELLLRRLDSGPGIEVTPQFVEQFKREVRGRRESDGLRP